MTKRSVRSIGIRILTLLACCLLALGCGNSSNEFVAVGGSGTTGTGGTGTGTTTGGTTGPASTVNFNVQPAAALAGSPISPAVVIQLVDASGNPVDSNAVVTLFLGNNPNGAQLLNNTATAVNGVATFNNLIVTKPGTGYTLIVTGAGITPTESAPFDVTLPVENFNLFQTSTTCPAHPLRNQGGFSAPRSLDTGDFNNDGLADWVAVAGEGGNVRVGLRQADGTFTFTDIALANVSAIAAGDVDNDGNDDIVALQRDDATKSLILSQGNGTFAAAVSTAAPTGANALRLADNDGDNLPELFIASESPDQLNVYNNGSGSFGGTASTTIALAGDGDALAVGNIDGSSDGLDVAVGTGAVNDLRVLFDYNGTAFPGGTTNISVTGSVRGVALGDVNGANGLDLLASTSSGNVSVFLNNGSGGFGGENLLDPATNMTPATNFQSIVAGDWDGDGEAEVAVADVQDETVRLFTNADPGDAFVEPIAYAVPDEPQCIAAAEMSGDTTVDLLSLNKGDNFQTISFSQVAILVNNGTGGFGNTRLGVDDNGDEILETSPTQRPAFGDVNGDTFTDLAVAVNNDTVGSEVNEIQIWLGDGTGNLPTVPDVRQSTIGPLVDYDETFGPPFPGTFTTRAELRTNPVDLAILDLDGDTLPDLAVADAANDNGNPDNPAIMTEGARIRFFLNQGNGTVYNFDTLTNTPTPPVQIYAVNLDADPELELVARCGAEFAVLNGTYPFTGGEVTTFPDQGVSDSWWGDIDGDGDNDIVGAQDTRAIVFVNDGTGAFTTSFSLFINGNPSANTLSNIAVGDLNGDNIADIAGSQRNASVIHTWLSVGGTFNTVSFSADTLQNPQGLSIGDVNGDNLPDIVVGSADSSNLTVFRNQGTGAFQYLCAFLTGWVNKVTIVDLNGDGRNDIAAGSAVDPNGLFPLIQQTTP